MLRIGLDIDNTIADFDSHYLRRFGKFPNHDWGITRNVNNILIKEKAFWLTLPILRMPEFKPRLYCSSRINPKQWTKTYLQRNDFPEAPLYQVKGYGTSKYDALKGRVDVFIDDSIFNFEDLNIKGILCLLITTNSNSHYDTPLRIHDLNIDTITDKYYYAVNNNLI